MVGGWGGGGGARFVPMVSRDNAADVLGNCGGRVLLRGWKEEVADGVGEEGV